MRTAAVLVTVLSVALPVSAQNNRFEVYPLLPDFGAPGATATSFTDRTPIGVNAGELLCEQQPANHKGVGDDGTNCVIPQFFFVWQDENLATQESYRLIFRRLLGGTGPGPDPAAAGILLQTGTVTNAAGTGRGAFQTTLTFATPLPMVPCDTGYCYGVALGAAPGWASFTDGQSVHGAFYRPNGVAGDNPRTGAPNLAWAVDAAGTTQLVRPAQSARIGLQTLSGIIAIGGIDPANTRQPAGTSNYGAGGVYPDITNRSDGLDARILEARKPVGLALLLMSYQPGLANGIPFAGIDGRLWINPNLFFLGNTALDAAGKGVIPIAPPGSLPAGLAGNFLIFQAVTIDQSFVTISFTNSAQVNF
jgi:hypothetical protein